MRKLVRGIVEFRAKVRPDYSELFARLALEQKPDALFVACSDSRVVPNLFASTDPGDLFVIRNVGNLIPPCDAHGRSLTDESEGAAIEFALHALQVSDMIVCGHSECGAMRAITEGCESLEHPHLKSWLRHASQALAGASCSIRFADGLKAHDRLSQLNVLQQLEHLRTYPVVRERIRSGTLRLHGWWFDIATAEVSAYDSDERAFLPIDERRAAKILSDIGEGCLSG